MNKIQKKEATSFDGLGIAPKLLEILAGMGYTTPTPIQSQSIPVSLERKDIVGIAQTGTGKTLAFGIPMLQLLATHKGMGLVVLPTRELALQVDENLKTIGEKIGLRTSVLIGGEPIQKQLKSLKRKPHIIIATPGRLNDHTERKSVNLSNVRVLVLDEADMMLDMGFLSQIRNILKLVPKDRQTMLFSATMPTQIVKIASEYMKLPIRIEVAPAGTAAENVEQEIIVVEKAYKIDYLRDILGKTNGSVLIFMRTKHTVKALTRKLKSFGFTADEIHSNRSLGQRRAALEGFKTGKYRVLIATDIAARGIDVKGIELVINFDLPEKAGDYVHRIGRTARAGKSGKAISFVMPSQIRALKEIEKLINKNIKKNKTEKELEMIVRTVPNEKKGNDRQTRVPRKNTGARRPMRSSARARTASTPERKPFNKITPKESVSYSRNHKPTRGSAKKSSNNKPRKSQRFVEQRRLNDSTPRPMTDKEAFRISMRPKRR